MFRYEVAGGCWCPDSSSCPRPGISRPRCLTACTPSGNAAKCAFRSHGLNLIPSLWSAHRTPPSKADLAILSITKTSQIAHGSDRGSTVIRAILGLQTWFPVAITRCSALSVSSQPRILTREVVADDRPVGRLFVQCLRIPLTARGTKEVAAVDVNSERESQ
jgi:hypothetical protein